MGEIGSPWEAALAAGWEDTRHPGDWEEVMRRFRDGHEEEVWWALEVDVGPPTVPRGSAEQWWPPPIPNASPDKATWYLLTNLPHPGSEHSQEESGLVAADLAEIARLYGLRMWVEQSYERVKHALGWSDYQVIRSDLAIRRHRQLVCCAFTFCW